MNIAIFGLGYVGSVSAACLAAAGHQVTGVDVDPQKLDLVRRGRSPVTEPDLDEWLANGVHSGRLRVTDEPAEAVRASDISLVCVGTPSRRNGSLDSTFLERVLRQIGEALRADSRYHVVAIRSTLLPGVLESLLLPLLTASSGRAPGSTLGVCINPEFLREGSAIRDFQHPPFTIIGETDPCAGDALLQAYSHLHAPVHRLHPDEASMIKYASNAFHALKVAFANEIGAMSGHLGLDGRTVMRVFCEDSDLNLSARYLRPGFGFGGSCLPKDLRALTYLGKMLDLATPLLGSVMASNEEHIRRVVDIVLETGKRRVALLGLSFKNGTDDLRESPFVTLAEALIGKGLLLQVWDTDVSVGRLVGRNRAYIDEHLPHLSQLMVQDWESAIRDADVVIVGKLPKHPEAVAQALRRDQVIVDLVGSDTLGQAKRPWSQQADARAAVERLPLGSSRL